MAQVIHYPTLQTVLAVEDVLRKQEDALTRNEIKRRLKKKIMHQTLNVIISYLEESGKIMDTPHGVLWTYCPPKEMQRILKSTTPVTPKYLQGLRRAADKGIAIHHPDEKRETRRRTGRAEGGRRLETLRAQRT